MNTTVASQDTTHILHRQLRSGLPLAVGGEGAWLIGADGKRYLDGSGGAAVSCLGHAHPEVLAAMHAQIDRLAYAHTSFFTTAVAEELGQELVRSATASATAGDVDALANNATASDEHSEETHTTCAWCLTHALEAGLAHAPARPPQVPAEPSAIAPHSADPFTAQQVRWPFAARDPPPAQRA